MKGDKIKQIGCGFGFTLILNDNELFSFGDNQEGQLGIEDKESSNTPILVMKDEIESIHCGGDHSLIYKKTGEIFAIGSNEFGQLGIAEKKVTKKPIFLMKDTKILEICCGLNHSMILCEGGNLFVFGDNFCGQIGLGKITKKQFYPTLLMRDASIKNICCGGNHSFILKKTGEVLVSGDNSYGQLSGTQNQVYFFQLMTRDIQIKQICCGFNHTILHTKNGQLFAFGQNNEGQLGIGNLKDQRQMFPLMKKNVLLLISGNLPRDWYPSNHSVFPSSFRATVLAFTIVLFRYQRSNGLKIPKWVIFEIIKNILI